MGQPWPASNSPGTGPVDATKLTYVRQPGSTKTACTVRVKVTFDHDVSNACLATLITSINANYTGGSNWSSHANLQTGWVTAGLLGSSAPVNASITSPFCFIHDTIFHTLKDNTEVPIEIQNLKVGDLVKTEVYVNQKECQFSLDAWQRIKRMIHRPLTADEYANETRILPKDAFGPGKPDKDLHVTWGHGLLLKEMKEEWKNDEYNGDHVTYSKEHALVKGDFIKLLAGHCSLCRKPNEEENKKADEEREKRAYYHLELEGKEKVSQHALVTHGVTSESLTGL